MLLFTSTACSRTSTVTNDPTPPAVTEEQNTEPEQQAIPQQKDAPPRPEDENQDGTTAEPEQEEILSSQSFSFWYQIREGRAQTASEIEQLLDKYDGIFIGPPQKTVYLTFDLGYEAGYTARILDALKEQDVKAAFFVTGDFVKKQPQLVKRMAAEGHLIGNHTENHPDLSSLTPEAIIQELKSVDHRLAALGLPESKFFRPPQGVFSEVVLKTALDKGYRAVLWSFAYRDWLTDDQPEPGFAKETILKGTFPGSVLLLHGVSRSNTAVLGDVITTLKSNGYSFGSLDDL